ncbi:MAG: Lrp/AsnC family transcriptional regulator [Fibrobacter sp.]|nr:Lrp/AsnC family transcriptional regulator [Fibrobacter sp.]
MTEKERVLLNIIQNEFPLVEEPFKAIAEKASITERTCISILRSLSANGIIRTIRAVINWNKAGIGTVLIGIIAEPESLDAIASEINRIDEVTHNYAREGIRNLWCTLIYESDKQKNTLLKNIQELQGVRDVKEFPAEKTYKIGLVLDV